MSGRSVDAVRLLVAQQAFDSLFALLRRTREGSVAAAGSRLCWPRRARTNDPIDPIVACSNELEHHRAFGVAVDELLPVTRARCSRCTLPLRLSAQFGASQLRTLRRLLSSELGIVPPTYSPVQVGRAALASHRRRLTLRARAQLLTRLQQASPAIVDVDVVRDALLMLLKADVDLDAPLPPPAPRN